MAFFKQDDDQLQCKTVEWIQCVGYMLWVHLAAFIQILRIIYVFINNKVHKIKLIICGCPLKYQSKTVFYRWQMYSAYRLVPGKCNLSSLSMLAEAYI